MAGVKTEIVIQGRAGEVLARMNVENAILDGHCEWFDMQGSLVSYGLFRKGLPYAGTFLNWANYMNQVSKENPYDVATYCRDWVTVFEAGFASELPKYEPMLEAYSKGQRVSL